MKQSVAQTSLTSVNALMFERRILTDLAAWAKETKPKPLVLRGARQVGKTTVVELFARQFEHFVHLNLEKHEHAALFTRGLSTHDLLQSIALTANTPILTGKTLLFLDEIQESPQAVSMLRYLYEERPGLHVIAAGSLLEAMLDTMQGAFPVGRVRYMFLHPLTFAEFLNATGEEAALKVYQTVPLPHYAHGKLEHLYHRYALVGGMPEIVATYGATQDIGQLGPLYQGLLTAYLDDVVKYARNATMAQVIRHAIESAPLQAGARIKFEGFGRSNYRSREMGEALRTLEKAMLLRLVHPSTAIKPPPVPDKKKSPRLLFLDTGLVNYRAGLQGSFFEHADLNDVYQGRIAEHIVGQELMASVVRDVPSLVFWVREKKQSSAEVDYLLQHGKRLIPIEVKSGKVGTLRSLHVFMDRAGSGLAVRLYGGELRLDQAQTPKGTMFQLLNLPYSLTGQVMQYVEWIESGGRVA